jgi:hypothetical protein
MAETTIAAGREKVRTPKEGRGLGVAMNAESDIWELVRSARSVYLLRSVVEAP